MSSDSSHPFVSVIVPVRDASREIGKTIQALLEQDYPRESYEVIIVDNGSTDGTRDIVSAYPVTLLSEPIRSSYAARNRGIASARGEVLAFTDADCVPDRSWISQGISFLRKHSLELAGGNVRYTFSGHPTGAEYADALINIDNERSIRDHGTAATANLFVSRHVFSRVGMFDASLQSGGDGEWGERARRAGITVGYAAGATVEHPARSFRELMRKHIRIGSGSNAVWRARSKNILWRCAAFLYLLTPLYLVKVPNYMRRKGWEVSKYPTFGILGVVYACKLATAWGIVRHAWYTATR